MATILSLDITDLPADGETLVYDAAIKKWRPGPGGGGSSPDASTTVKGIVELATNTEATTGTDTVRAVTPAGMKAALDALPGGLVTVNAQTGAYSLVVADGGKAVEVTSATPVIVTVPTNATQGFPIGSVIEIYQLGAGQVSIAPAGGVTIESRGGLLDIAGQFGVASLRKRATNTWVLAGDLS